MTQLTVLWWQQGATAAAAPSIPPTNHACRIANIMGKIDQPFRRLLARISNEIAEGSSEKADRGGRWRVSAGGHGCGGEDVVGNGWFCHGIETDGGGVDAKLKYSCEIQWSGIGITV